MATLFPEDATGLELPDFDSLLIKGSYHASAPIHLCLSHLASEESRSVLLFTPSRREFLEKVKEVPDSWLALNLVSGDVTEKASRIRILYPPTPTHLSLLLATIRVSSDSGPDANSVMLLDEAPTLIVLHEPSGYFTQSQGDQPSSAQSRPPRFALFDSRIESLKLPLAVRLRRNRFQLNDEEDTLAANPQPINAFIPKYFSWICTISDGSSARPIHGLHIELAIRRHLHSAIVTAGRKRRNAYAQTANDENRTLHRNEGVILEGLGRSLCCFENTLRSTWPPLYTKQHFIPNNTELTYSAEQ
ncbi:hypothetical protein FISHEDRAFT_39628 [Fistulina hepatica ATCC 64428]|uniref:Uncharacterized protein n=1 Tax=Fistulina hepatica ATCC 64428 TaxID=1128425 RepID=A0A0D7AH21_9AGAR|nr:hypothetical protein FISHEDRAFT_39628 [Fistulina hepatica ATCC 64428]